MKMFYGERGGCRGAESRVWRGETERACDPILAKKGKDKRRADFPLSSFPPLRRRWRWRDENGELQLDSLFPPSPLPGLRALRWRLRRLGRRAGNLFPSGSSPPRERGRRKDKQPQRRGFSRTHMFVRQKPARPPSALFPSSLARIRFCVVLYARGEKKGREKGRDPFLLLLSAPPSLLHIQSLEIPFPPLQHTSLPPPVVSLLSSLFLHHPLLGLAHGSELVGRSVWHSGGALLPPPAIIMVMNLLQCC